MIRFISVPASQISSLRCGGLLEKVFAPSSIREAEEFFSENPCDNCTVIGGLTNTLVLSGGLKNFAVISDGLTGVTVEGDTIKASSGEKLANIARLARCYGLKGMENLCGIPGTVGGAVAGNAGSFGTEISDVLLGAEILKTDTGEREFLSREEIAFGYRYSNLRIGKDLLLKAHFRLYPAPVGRIAARMEEVKRLRAEKQPPFPSLGSVFKKCGETSAGWYIEKVGLKGFRYGGMEFSERHANFIVNRGGTPEDYLYLVRLAEKKVYETFGIKLVREVKIIGEQGDL